LLRQRWYLAAGAPALFAFAVTLYLLYVLGSHMPHVPDSVSYIFQAKILAAGHLTAPAPSVERAFAFFYPPLIAVDDGKWFSVFPFGHPLMLALGQVAGLIWLIPPALGAASVMLIADIGRRVYNLRTGLLAASLVATSPFFLMTASNFMSHNTAAFYLLLSLWCLTRIESRPLLYAMLSGLFFGLLFNTRPLTAVALVPPFAGYLLLLVFIGRGKANWRPLAGFCLGGLLMLGAYFLYNMGATGEPGRGWFWWRPYTGSGPPVRTDADGISSAGT
jgi:4-amino-4-deoxy-L-arabinose transferase-like glycosyltransferase